RSRNTASMPTRSTRCTPDPQEIAETRKMALVEVKVPDIGDFKDVEIIELLVKPGDTVKAEQSLITVESDKASMEIPSSHAGTVKEIKVKVGDKVTKGSAIATLEGAVGTAGSPPAAAAPTTAAAPAAAAAPPSADPSAAPATASASSSAEKAVP